MSALPLVHADPAGQDGGDALMRRVQDDDVRAFELLYDRLAPQALGLARTICRDAGRAEEVVQEAFVAVWRDRARYDAAKGNVDGWALAIVRNRAVDAIRRDGRHARRRAAVEQIEDLEAPGSVSGDVVEREEADELRQSLRGLPDEQREVILLAYFGGLTHSEIARRHALPAGTVKGRMRLGLEKLRRLTPDGP